MSTRNALPLLLMAGLALSACKKSPPPADAPAATPVAPVAQPSAEIKKEMLAAYAPLPEVMASEKNPISEPKVALGRMLYYETRISKNHDLSCNSCHGLETFGVDNKPLSEGHRKQKGARNSPTVYNAAGHVAQFWDGREPDVEAQAKGPVLNPVEMAMPSDKHVVTVLESIPGYVAAFKAAFPDDKAPITYDNFGKAVGAFERKLVTPSKWDKFLAGDQAALSDDEKKGFNAFSSAGCPTCHTGPYLGGHMFQKLGLVKPWPDQKDLGRFTVTKNEAEKMYFKVPSLRNVAKTGPYFHDGGVADLKQAVVLMARHQLGRELDDQTAGAIITFLGALTGELPTELIKQPELPPSGNKTPKPDPA